MAMSQPFRIDGTGRTASAAGADHVRQEIETLLFTQPGERVNRPDLGSGLLQLIFAPSSSELATATQYLVQGALQRWLGDLAQVDSVEVTSDEAVLTVVVRYRLPGAPAEVATFTRAVPP
jgi:phage baseplate assembly protein W